jgi:hypothetical protein
MGNLTPDSMRPINAPTPIGECALDAFPRPAKRTMRTQCVDALDASNLQHQKRQNRVMCEPGCRIAKTRAHARTRARGIYGAALIAEPCDRRVTGRRAGQVTGGSWARGVTTDPARIGSIVRLQRHAATRLPRCSA